MAAQHLHDEGESDGEIDEDELLGALEESDGAGEDREECAIDEDELLEALEESDGEGEPHGASVAADRDCVPCKTAKCFDALGEGTARALWRKGFAFDAGGQAGIDISCTCAACVAQTSCSGFWGCSPSQSCACCQVCLSSKGEARAPLGCLTHVRPHFALRLFCSFTAPPSPSGTGPTVSAYHVVGGLLPQVLGL